MKLALVSRLGSGGLYVVTLKLLQALRSEGFDVELFNLQSGAVHPFLNDFQLVHSMKDYDVILYTGSIARISSVLTGKRFGIFIHGLITDEYRNAISHSNVRSRMGAVLEYSWWKTVNMTLFKPDFYICHSKTMLVRNEITSRSAILPQFLLPSEIKKLKQVKDNCENLNKIPKILTYRSYAESSRLLPQSFLVQVAQVLGRKIKKKVDFIIIDPMISKEQILDYGMVILKIIKPMPRPDFLSVLASSHLYIETCTDEEIGLDSIEAGFFKVPLVKITYPQFMNLQDYSEDEVIIASSPSMMVEKLSIFLENANQNKQYYGQRFNDYVLKKRSWNNVKKALLNEING